MYSTSAASHSRRLIPFIILMGCALLSQIRGWYWSISGQQQLLRQLDFLTSPSDTLEVGTYNRTLIVYSGPTSLENKGKNELYRRNFEYFLKHGIACSTADTVLVLTDSVAMHYQQKIHALDAQCQNRVLVITREDVCFDMESFRVVLYDSTINVESYDYLLFVNCGMSGPKLPDGSTEPWTHRFTSMLSETIKMVGLTLNCFRGAHVQSFVFALDKTGIDVIKKSNAVFDCRKTTRRPNSQRAYSQIVRQYERGMSQAILNAGYGIAGAMNNVTAMTMDAECHHDIWEEASIREYWGGRVPLMNETIFFKSSRFLPNHIAQEIDYPLDEE